MIYAGIVVILLLNAFTYYDYIQHNSEMFKDKKIIYNITVALFTFIEILIFVCVYVFINELMGVFNDWRN